MTTTQYRYLGVDGSVSNVAQRYHTTVEDLWRLNDAGHRFASASAWAQSIRPLAPIIIEHPAEETRWQWDLWEDVSGNPTLEEFCNQRNQERERLARRNRPVGPRYTPAFLWHALINHGFRHESLMREANASGATAGDVERIENNPGLVYVRAMDRAGRQGALGTLFVPSAPVSTSAATGAAPRAEGGQAGNTLHVQPHWVRELQDRLVEIRHKSHELRNLLRRQQDAVAGMAGTLATFSRLDEMLRILVEGRNERVWAAGSASTLADMQALRTSLHSIAERAARVGARRREMAVSAETKDRVSNELKDLARAPRLNQLFILAARDGIMLNRADVTTEANNVIGEAYRVGAEAAAQWAHDDIERAMTPDPTSAAARLALYTSMILPTIGNTAGPPSVWVWLVQYRAARSLQGLLGQATSASAVREAVDQLVTRYAALSYTSFTADQYRGWMSRVNWEEAMAEGFRIRGATPTEWLGNYERWRTATTEAGPAHQIRARIIGAIEEPGLDRSVRVARLRTIASDITSNVHTGSGASSVLLVLNLALIIANVVQFRDGETHMPEMVAGVLGCSYTSAMAAMQILANRAPSGIFYTVLETYGTAFGHVAAFLGVAQGLVGAYATWRDWGFSHPVALASSMMSVGSGALLWVGWAAASSALTGIGLVFAAGAIGLSIIGDDDPGTKITFLHFMEQFGQSAGIRDIDGFLADHPDGAGHGSTMALDLRAVRTTAQQKTFPLAVWNEHSALRSIGFSDGDVRQLTEPRPNYNVGPVAPSHPQPPRP